MTDDLKSLILRLEGRVTSLEGGKAPAAKPAAEVNRGVYFLKISSPPLHNIKLALERMLTIPYNVKEKGL